MQAGSGVGADVGPGARLRAECLIADLSQWIDDMVEKQKSSKG